MINKFLTPVQALEGLDNLPAGASVMLLGATDTGKTTFAFAAANRLSGQGKSAAYLDCDLGQSEVGPPGTVGFALVEAGRTTPLRTGRDLSAVASAFVGATSPAGHLLDTVIAVTRMARDAQTRNPDVLLVDTPGWVHGPAARAFAHSLINSIQPHVILAFGAEGERLLLPFHGLKSPLIWRVTPDPSVIRKNQSVRAARRIARFAAALEGATEITLALDAVALCGTELFTGAALPFHVQQFIARSLSVPVLHAEHAAGEAPYVVINGESWNRGGLAAVSEYFHATHLTVVPAQRFARLLVGLVDEHQRFLALGLITRIDFAAQTLTLLTPCRRPAAIAQVWCGSVRVRPDGREIASLKPGSL